MKLSIFFLSAMAAIVSAQATTSTEDRGCNYPGCGTAQRAEPTTMTTESDRGCNYPGCGTAQRAASTAEASSSGGGCNYPGCGTAQRAFAAPTHIPVAHAVMGFGALGAAAFL